MIREDKHSPDLEHELVYAVISLDRSKDERIYKILDGPVDWPLFIRIATQHGILPLCYQRLLPLAEKNIPPNDIAYWKVVLQANMQNNFRLTWKLVQCVELLSDNGIECIVLKGPVFALQAYRDLSLRQFSDLDILIHEIDFPRAYDLLVKSGYSPIFKLEKKQKKFLVRTDNHFSFNRQGDVIEVHWEFAPRENIHPLTPDQMWQELNSIQISDKSINTLSPENTILFTCLHGAKHGWNQLKWIVDLAYLCQSFSEKSWLTLLDHAKSKGLFRQVCLGLLLAEDLVDAVLPSKVRDLINTDRHAQLLASQVRASLFKRSIKPCLFEDYKFYLMTRERWRDRLYYLFDLIILPKKPDWTTISLPENFYLLYYIFRPIRLLYILGKAALSGWT